MHLNKILTSINAALKAKFLGASGQTIESDQLAGVPLGTKDGTATGELAAKVMVVGSAGAYSIPPFNSQTFTYFGSTNNVQTIVYKQGVTTVATLTFTYVSGGVADNDLVQTITLS